MECHRQWSTPYLCHKISVIGTQYKIKKQEFHTQFITFIEI